MIAGGAKNVAALVAIFLGGAAGVTFVRSSLNATFAAVTVREDVYVLPPPSELKHITLGYEAATADMIWAQLLVEYGRHWAEKRPFPDLDKYIDAILALDPASPVVYRFVDTLLMFRPLRGTEADARKARAYLEMGTRERPYDRDVWMQYGQFVAFLAPSFLEKQEERDAWRIDGSKAIVRAAELGGNVDGAITASSMLSRAGRRAVALEYLERASALAQDPQSVAEIQSRLLLAERDLGSDESVASMARRAQRDARDARARIIDGRWRSDTPFLSRGEYLLLGPFPDPLLCTGPGRHARPECAGDWEHALSVVGL